MSSLPFAAFAQTSGFCGDPRFSASQPVSQPVPPSEPATNAWDEGYATGFADAHAEAEANAAQDSAMREKIVLTFGRLDVEMAEQLRQRLADTVAALCEAAVAPLALDPEALTQRVRRATDMLTRAEDDRVLRLHPDDIALLDGMLPDNVTLQPDPALERGAIRVETSSGGVEDGPSHWRRAIAEALATC